MRWLLWRVQTSLVGWVEMAGPSVVFSPLIGLRYQGFNSYVAFFMPQGDLHIVHSSGGCGWVKSLGTRGVLERCS